MVRSTHTLAIKSQKWILESLLDLMNRKSYDEITVTEICKNAQLDRRTFYRNFKDKDDVMEFYIATLQSEFLATLKYVKVRAIHSMAKAQFDFWKEHLEFLLALHKNNILMSLILKVTNEFIPTIYTEFHEQIPSNFQYKSAFIIGGFCNILFHWLSTGAKESSDEIAKIVSELFDDNNPYWSSYIQN